MKIVFQRSGGFAGMLVKTTIHTNDLDATDAKKITQLIQASDFYALTDAQDGGDLNRDGFSYEITITSADKGHTLKTSDGTAPAKLKPLLQELSLLARKSRKI